VRVVRCKQIAQTSQQELAQRVHSYIVTSSAWVYLRHWSPTKTVPWILAKLVDHRVPVATRTGIVEQLAKLFACCADRFTQAVLDMVDNPADLFSPLWQERLWAWVRSIYLHTASLENRHARNKQQTKSECTVWSNFCAQYLLSESKCLMKHHLKLHTQHRSLSALRDQARTKQALEDKHRPTTPETPTEPERSVAVSSNAPARAHSTGASNIFSTTDNGIDGLAEHLGLSADLIKKSGFVRSGKQLYHLHRSLALRGTTRNPITSSFWSTIHASP